MAEFHNTDGKSVLLKMAEAIRENKGYLSDVDGLIGDGDHGANMSKGFTMFAERAQGRELSFTDGLEELGMVLLNEIGGSMGPIYGTVFMEMAASGEDFDIIGARELRDMLSAGLEGLYEIVEARVGDKTLVDTLVPAVEALGANEHAAYPEALAAMRRAAEAGRDSTRDMVAKFGRSSRLGERSRGVLDAGATSCCIILSAMAEGIRDVLEAG
jgi:dihydroxyacetone kinase-like protein